MAKPKPKPAPPTQQITIRLDHDTIERADALAAKLTASPAAQAMQTEVTRAHLLRLAVNRGLDVLERENTIGGKNGVR